MSPMQFLAKTENGLCSSPLKWNKDSHLIKKSSLESSSSSASSLITSRPQQHQCHGPVIIYTHSPKIIHTHPKDFMSLVQKLTGLSRSEEEGFVKHGHDAKSSSVITDENCNNVSNINVDQVNSCFVLPIFEPPHNPYMDDIPIFTLNSDEFLHCTQSLYGCTDSLFFHA